MTLIIHIVLFCFFMPAMGNAIMRHRYFDIQGVNRKHLLFFFALKVVAGVGLTLIYTYYYTDASKADIYRYFNDSKVITSLAFTHPKAWLSALTGIGLNDADNFKYLLPTQYFSHPQVDISTENALIIRIASLFNFVSVNNIYIDTLLFNFLSFVGLIALFKAVKRYFMGFQQALYLPLFMLPSVIFWGSGLLKEQLLFTFLGFFLYAGYLSPAWRVTIRLLLFWMIYSVKPAVGFCLLAALFFLPDVAILMRRRVVVLIAMLVVLIVACCFFNLHTHIAHTLLSKRNEFTSLALSQNAGSYFDRRIYGTSVHDFISLLPSAFVNVILRPFLWNKSNAFQLLFAFENLLFLLLNAFLLLRYFKWPKGEKLLFACFCLAFAGAYYALIGFTVPIMGAIVHYRVIAGMFLSVTVLCFVDLKKLSFALLKLRAPRTM